MEYLIQGQSLEVSSKCSINHCNCFGNCPRNLIQCPGQNSCPGQCKSLGACYPFCNTVNSPIGTMKVE